MEPSIYLGGHMENQSQTSKTKNKQSTWHVIVGLMLGNSIAWMLGLGGLIPYIICFALGSWITYKAMNSQSKIIRATFWLAFVVILMAGLIIRGIKSTASNSSNSSAITTKTINLDSVVQLETDKSPANSKIEGSLYRNLKYNFRIKFPENWEIEPGDGLHVVQKASSGNSTISVIIMQFDLKGEPEIDNISQIATKDEYIPMIVESIKPDYPDMVLLGSGETKIDNKQAYWMEHSASYQALDKKLKMKFINYWVIDKDIMYTISAGSSIDDYESVKPTIIQSIETFVLENK